jgi:nucleoside permease NupC
MAVEVIQETKEQVTETVATIQEDGWSKAFDDVIQMDFSGFSTLFVILLLVIFIKPILFVLRYVVIAAILFMFVKYYLFYAQ